MSPFLKFVWALVALRATFGIALATGIFRAKESRIYWPLVFLGLSQIVPLTFLVYLRKYHVTHPSLTAIQAYHIYFGIFWGFALLDAVASLLLIRNIFNDIMRPLEGLLRLGNVMFGWVAAVSASVGIFDALSPHRDALDAVTAGVGEIARVTSIATLMSLLFVMAALRHFGLSYRSRLFGTSFGLLAFTIISFFDANQIGLSRNLYDQGAALIVFAWCLPQTIWVFYFWMPEPERGIILLPSTSPYHTWNAIGAFYGAPPTDIAIAGVSPESFAFSELEVIRRASAKMAQYAEEDRRTFTKDPSEIGRKARPLQDLPLPPPDQWKLPGVPASGTAK